MAALGDRSLAHSPQLANRGDKSFLPPRWQLSALTEFHAPGCLYVVPLRAISPPRDPLNIRESERKAVSKRDTMVQRRQRGWLKKKSRITGETWVLHLGELHAQRSV
jgi:hypothetical protein